MKFRTLLLAVALTAITSVCSTSQAGEFHLPGRPVQRASNLLSVVAKPVKATVVGVAKVKPVRSVLKVLFF